MFTYIRDDGQECVLDAFFEGFTPTGVRTYGTGSISCGGVILRIKEARVGAGTITIQPLKGPEFTEQVVLWVLA